MSEIPCHNFDHMQDTLDIPQQITESIDMSITSSVFNNKLNISETSINSSKNPEISLSSVSESRIIVDDLVSESGTSPTYQNLLKKLPIIKYEKLTDKTFKNCLVCQEEFQ